MRPSFRRSWIATLTATAILVAPALPRAQTVLTLWGNYYKERSTRVISPTVGLATQLDEDTQLDLTYLVDNITSASGIDETVDDGEPFQEFRQEVRVQVSRRLNDFLIPTVGARYSYEPDYTSLGYRAGLTAELFQRNTTVSVYLQGQNDAIHARFNNVEDTLDTYMLSFSLSQVLTPRLLIGFDFEAQFLDGYTENPYRNENHPPERTRYALGGWAAYRLPGPGTTLRASYRHYFDDWRIRAHSVELKLFQRLTDDLELVPMVRIHTQTGADFADWNERIGITFRTNDPKLMALGTTALGLRLVWSLSFLKNGPLHPLHRATVHPKYQFYAQRDALELNPIRLVAPEAGAQTAFGDAHIAELGFALPL